VSVKSDDETLDILWGAEAIGEAIGQPPRATFHLLESGAIPAAARSGLSGRDSPRAARSPVRRGRTMSATSNSTRSLTAAPGWRAPGAANTVWEGRVAQRRLRFGEYAGTLEHLGGDSWAAYDLKGKELGRGPSLRAALQLLPPWPGTRDINFLIAPETLEKLAEIAKVPQKNRQIFCELMLEIIQRVRSEYSVRIPRKHLGTTKKIEAAIRGASARIVGELDCAEYKIFDQAIRMQAPGSTGIRNCSAGGRGCSADCPLRIESVSYDGRKITFGDLILTLNAACDALARMNNISSHRNRYQNTRRPKGSVSNPYLRVFVYRLLEAAKIYGGKLTFEKVNGGTTGQALQLLRTVLPGFIPNELRTIYPMIDRVRQAMAAGHDPLENPAPNGTTSKSRNI
jgi:hypothetical protein